MNFLCLTVTIVSLPNFKNADFFIQLLSWMKNSVLLMLAKALAENILPNFETVA